MRNAIFTICLTLGLVACGGGGGGFSGETPLSPPLSADVPQARAIVVNPTLAAQPVSVVNTTLAGEQLTRAIGALPDGGYIVVWITGTALFLQRYDNAGDKVGGEVSLPVTVPVFDPIGIREGSVAVLSDGSVVVAYEVDVNVGATAGTLQFRQSIYIQRFDAQGNRLLGETEVFSRLVLASDTPNGAPSITALADGGFVVAWFFNAQFPTNLSRSTLFKRRYDSQAQPVGPVVTVGSFLLAATPRTGFRLAADASGGYTLSISSLDDTFSLLPVLFIHYDANDAATQLAAPNAGEGAVLLPLRGDRFVLLGTGSSGAVLQFLDAAGNPVGDPVPLAATPTDALELADGSFVVFLGDNSTISAQRFDSAGIAMGKLLSVGNGGSVPRTAALADGGFASAWTAVGALAPGDVDVFTQRFIEVLTPDQPALRARRKACLASAMGMRGQERKAFVDTCLAR
jgi:hypothetical protein